MKIEKKHLSFVRLKSFTRKVNMDLILSKGNVSSRHVIKDVILLASNNKIKVSLYRFLKTLKVYKKNFNSFYFLSESYGHKLQNNGFYTSLIELDKKNKMRVLTHRVSMLENRKVVMDCSPRFFFSDFPLSEIKNLKGLAKGFEKFEKFYGDYSRTSEKRQVFLRTLKNRRFFNKVFINRLFLYAARGQKKYRHTFFYFFRRKRKINSLFHVYTLSSLKFKDFKKQRKKVLKRLAWKIRKQKKWKRHGSLNLFRLRQKLSQVFYVPKHFEINYKTLAASYLGYTDLKTTNVRIPFWLNLRKLMTFLL